MAINAPLWRKNACEIVGCVVDENFQRTAWFGRGQFVSSPEELYNSVFSDLAFEEFISSPDIALNDLQRTAATKLVGKMRYFEKVIGKDLSANRVIDHPGWREVREAAQRVLDVLQCPRRTDV